MGPSDSDIDAVCMITGLDPVADRSLVTAALKAKNNSTEAVINEFFDDQDKFRSSYRWDETAFSSDREGIPNSAIPSFAIHSPDEGVIHGVSPDKWHGETPGAPSRPPSRANNRSPLSRMVDLTTNHADAPSSREQEDADLQRAIAESVAVSGVQSPQPEPQESGVIQGETTKYFGPTNREDYDQSWAMVPVPREREEPGPLRRKREPGVPAFLRCRRTDWAKHRLGATLTIYHEIPAARNAMLRSGQEPLQGYGYDAEWWAGQRIPTAPVPEAVGLAPEVAEALAGIDKARTPFSEELHRLMAFLDLTERRYGTADVLAEMKHHGWPSDNPETEFLDWIKQENEGTDKIRSLLSQSKTLPVLEASREWSIPAATSEWCYLMFGLQNEFSSSYDDLYSLWDSVFMMRMDVPEPSNGPANGYMAVITEPCDVLTIHIQQDGLPPKFEIPQTFYLDRYLESHRVEMSNHQQDLFKTARALHLVQKSEQNVAYYKHPDGPIDRRKLARTVIEHDKKALWDLKAAALWRKYEESRSTDGEFHYLPGVDDELVEFTPEEEKVKKHYEAHIKIYEQKIASIDEKLENLAAQRLQCQQLLRSLAKWHTVPSDEQNWHPTHRYTLRGIADTPDIMWVCKRAEPDLMEMEGASTPADEWWKLGYVADDEEQIKAERTTFEKAVEESCGYNSTPILIYATDKALEEAPLPLSEPLKAFMRKDNRTFLHEVARDSPRDKKRGGSLVLPTSPPKRRNRSGSIDSMATNHASSSDGLDDDMRDAPFEPDDQDPYLMGERTVDLEMQELVDISVPVPEGRISAPPEGDEFGIESPTLGRESIRFANVSLSAGDADIPNGVPDIIGPQPESAPEPAPEPIKGPEMIERSGPLPLLTRQINGAFEGARKSVLDVDMDEPKEAHVDDPQWS